MKLSIIIPAHNEEKRISRTLSSYLSFFLKRLKDFEIIVVINNTKDDTLKVVKSFKNKKIKYLNFKEAIGKGGAIIEGFKAGKGDYLSYADADMSTNPEQFYELFSKIDNYDGIIASRWIKGARVYPRQTFLRRIASRSLNFIMKCLFLMPYYDTQTGAKLFKKEAIRKVINKLDITKWAFDIDLLYNLRKNKFNIKEIPTVWHDKPGSQLKIFKAVPEMFLALIRLRLIYSKFKFIVKLYDKLPEWLKIHHKLI